MIDAITRALNWDTVVGWFHVLNDLSVVYVIVPLFPSPVMRFCGARS